MVKAIIFDMDGVIFDTEKMWIEACITIANDWGYKICPDFVVSCMGKRIDTIKSMFKEKLDPLSFEKDGKEFDFDKYRNEHLVWMDNRIKSRGMPVKEGFLDLIKFAKKRKLWLAVATSSDQDRTLMYFKEAGIPDGLFDVIMCGGMVKKGKPEPDIFLEVCRRLEIEPNEAIVLEDSKNGILAAYRAGTKPVMVIDCIQPTPEIEKMLVIPPLKSLTEVQGVFKQLNT